MYNDSGGKMKDVAPIWRTGGVYGIGKSLTELHWNSKAKQLALLPLRRAELQFHVLPKKEQWHDQVRTLVDMAMLCGSPILLPECFNFLRKVFHNSVQWTASMGELVCWSATMSNLIQRQENPDGGSLNGFLTLQIAKPIGPRLFALSDFYF